MMQIPKIDLKGANVRQIRLSSAALVCLLAVGCMHIAKSAEDLSGCTRIDDDAARLACYDRITGRGQVAAVTIAPAAATPAVTAAPAPVLAGTQDFGLSEADKKARDPQKYSASTLDSITRTVRSATKDGYGRFTITLDDGQVWKQVEIESTVAQPKAGDVVTISRAAMGSFQLRSDRTSRTRVRRLK